MLTLNQKCSELAKKERWLVFNKIDLIAEEQQQSKIDRIISKLDWQGSVYALSALTGKGTEVLSYNIMQKLEEMIVKIPEDCLSS